MTQYIHGTCAEEQKRLSLLNEILNEGSLRELALRGGERILDVGSGLGQFTRKMARAAGSGGSVIGIERSEDQLEQARRFAKEAWEEGLVEFRKGDACAMPLDKEEWGTFDVVHTRFLLEHVTDPLAVVRTMVRAARPGGRIILEDDDHDVLRAYPEPSGFGPLWTAYNRAFDRLGNDPWVGRRLVSLLKEADAEPARNTWVFFGSCAGHAEFDTYSRNLMGVIVSARSVIVDGGLLSAEGFDCAMDALERWRKRGDAALWYAVCWAEGRAPNV